MGRSKGKRASGHDEGRSDSTKRRPSPSDTITCCRVSGPAICPPPVDGRRRGRDSSSTESRDLESRRVYQETIFSIKDFLSPSECRAWIRFGEEQGFLTSFHRATSEMAHRDNGRISIDSPWVAAALWSRMAPFFPPVMGGRTASGCNANIRIYKYTVGQRFGKHIDESVEDENGHLSQWTVLVYLNGGEEEAKTAGVGETLKGGETVFYKGNYGDKVVTAFSPMRGTALIHGHGGRCLLHEGARVEQGVKYLLRTDVMYA